MAPVHKSAKKEANSGFWIYGSRALGNWRYTALADSIQPRSPAVIIVSFQVREEIIPTLFPHSVNPNHSVGQDSDRINAHPMQRIRSVPEALGQTSPSGPPSREHLPWN